jgi:hypothetical protein
MVRLPVPALKTIASTRGLELRLMIRGTSALLLTREVVRVPAIRKMNDLRRSS